MNWGRSMIGLAIALPLVGILAYGLGKDPGEIPSPLPGKQAPDFTLQMMDAAETVRLSDLRGQVVVLNFWGSWCYQCRVEHRDLSETATAYEDRGVRFYGILYNDEPPSARRWIEEMGGQSYPTLVDTRSRTAIAYGIYGAPETFIIDQTGTVVHKQIGPITSGLLRQIIDPLLTMEGAP